MHETSLKRLKMKETKRPRLDEDNLCSGVKVIYKGKEYETGNRYHQGVELYLDRQFICSIDMKDIEIVNLDTIIEPYNRRIEWAFKQLKALRLELKEWEKYKNDLK